jgi:hypothetical protein
MKTLKTTLLVIIILMAVTMAWAQNGTPQQVWSQTFDLFNGGSQNSNNVVLVGDKIFFTAKDYDEIKLVQIDKDDRQIGWVRNLGYNSGFGSAQYQMVVSNDYNLAVVDSGFVVRKISAQTGQDMWMYNLYSSPVQGWSLLAVTNYLICRGNRGSLVFLNWQTGEIISQMETAIPYQTPMGIHTVSSQDGQSLYLADVCQDGQYWNTSWRVTKLTLSPDLTNYQQNWQIMVTDETFPRITQSCDYLYVQSLYFDSLSNTTMKIRRINPQDGETVWTQNIGEPNEFDIQGLINNGDNVIAYGLHYGDYRPIMVNYNPSGTQTWSYSAPFPEGGFPYAMYRDAVWDGNVLILTGRASYSNQTATNSRAWLSAVSTTVANDDPTAPATPEPELTCYPNPFRGSTSVKFNQIDNSPTTIAIYNTRGQLVRTLVNSQKLSPGEHTVAWDGKTDSSQLTAAGVYFYKMTSGRFSSTRKMIMMK